MLTIFGCTPAMDPAIETQGLVKKYRDVTAVDGLSLRVEQGRDIRLPGTQRCGQNHNDPPAARNGQSYFGQRTPVG